MAHFATPEKQARGVDNKPRRRISVILLAIFSAALMTIMLAAWGVQHRAFNEIGIIEDFGSPVADEDRPTRDPSAGDSLNILIVGSDNRDCMTEELKREMGVGFQDMGNQSDTTMLMHIGEDTEYISIMSFPRDSFVTIPEHTDRWGNHHREIEERLNLAYNLGGSALTKRVIEGETGIHIDHTIEITFCGFLEMVDALNGVPVTIDNDIKDRSGNTKLNLKAGTHVLKGRQALDYVRSRYAYQDADFGRMRAQQNFVKGMFKQASDTNLLTDPLRLNSFVTGLLSSISVDESLTREKILELAERSQGFNIDMIEFLTVPVANENYTDPTTGKNWYMIWDEELAEEYFEAFRTNTPIDDSLRRRVRELEESRGKSPSQSPSASASASASPDGSPTGTTPTVPASEIQVQVFNGGGIGGLAARGTEDLRAVGFIIAGSPKDYQGEQRATTLIRHDASYEETLDTLKAAFPDAEFESVVGLGKTIEIILGSDYDGVADFTVTPTSAPETE